MATVAAFWDARAACFPLRSVGSTGAANELNDVSPSPAGMSVVFTVFAAFACMFSLTAAVVTVLNFAGSAGAACCAKALFAGTVTTGAADFTALSWGGFAETARKNAEIDACFGAGALAAAAFISAYLS
jgi:hypothetical protein